MIVGDNIAKAIEVAQDTVLELAIKEAFVRGARWRHDTTLVMRPHTTDHIDMARFAADEYWETGQ